VIWLTVPLSACANAQVSPILFERIDDNCDETGRGENYFVSRAIRSHNFWLVLTYVGLILLMARAYA
jgi:hypothetical protein